MGGASGHLPVPQAALELPPGASTSLHSAQLSRQRTTRRASEHRQLLHAPRTGPPKMRLPGKILWLMLWSVCVAQDCQGPPPKKQTEILTESRLEQSYPEGTKVTYKCRPGYRTYGVITMECKKGEWVSLNPSKICQKKPCGHPGDTPFGSFELAEGNKFEYGAKVVYTCNEGYKMIGDTNFRYCDADGWTNDVPLCDVVKCLPVEEPQNGRLISSGYELSQEYTFGQVVRFECKAGFKLDGPAEIHCSGSGLWSSDKPNCVAISCSLPQIPNGEPTSPKASYRENERLQYRCLPGYSYSGRAETVCTQSGWTPTPSCQEKTCDVPRIANSHFSADRSTYRVGDTIRYSCKSGFFPPPRGNTAKCTDTGWDPSPRCSSCKFPAYPLGNCFLTICLPFPYALFLLETCLKSKVKIENGFIAEPGSTYLLNQRVKYKCKQDYVTEDGQTSGSITCLRNGWSAQPRCIKRECIVPDIDPNLIAQPQKEKYVIGDVLRFSCRNRLLTLVGPDSLQCYHFGWSRNPPTCKEEVQPCDQPPRLPNGKVANTPKGEYGHGEVVEYVCNPRFLMKGARKIQCVDGEWTPLPVCVEENSTCGDVPELDHGEVVSPTRPSYYHGESVEFTCGEGFTMIGDSSVTCIRGTWTQPPQCIATVELKICKLSRATAYEINLSDKIDYEHNQTISYTCGRKSEQKRSVCVHGKWEPEVTCTGELLFRTFPNGGFPSCLVQGVSLCLTMNCPSPPSYDNAILVGWKKNSYKPGEQVTYQCPDYYQMDGSDVVQCRDGIWIGTPKCKDVSCGSPPSVQNAFIVNQKAKYRHGDRERYECRHPLGLFGKAEVTCLSGNWTDPPECKGVVEVTIVECHQTLHSEYNVMKEKWKRECIVPDIEENLIAQPRKEKYVIGDVLAFSCRNRLLTLVGPDSLQCYHFGWSPSPPTCKERECIVPDIEENLIAQPRKEKYVVGDVLTFSCRNRLLTLVGPDSLQCYHFGWSPSPPTCKDPKQCWILFLSLNIILVLYPLISIFHIEKTPCPQPPHVEHGSINSSRSSEDERETEEPKLYAHGTTLSYICKDGFKLSKEDGITCHQGKWSAPPQCVGLPCGPPPEVSNAVVVGRLNSYPHEAKFTYTCDSGFQLQGPPYVECSGGKWSSPPECTNVSCGSPPSVQNAFIPNQKPRYRNGDTARYECRQPLGLFGNPVVTCLSGKWTDPPECKESAGQCKPPPAIDNGDITTYPLAVYTPGSSVEYQCQAFYELEGNRRITCRDGQWSEPPKCLAMTCPSPPSYDNAILVGQPKNSYKSGEHVTYKFTEKCKMEGSSVVQCMNGRWIGTPTCKDGSCGSPPTVQNAFIQNRMPRYRPGDTVLYECTNSLGLFGNPVVTCLSGEWTDPPECKESTGLCGPPPAIDNGDITTYPLAVYTPGSSVEYQCQAFYELEGNRRITCRDGQWSEPPKCLDACVISEEIMKEHNIQLKWSYAKKMYSGTNDYVEFMCRSPYRRVSPASAFRVQCHEGKMEYPTCA
ncbi:PREDICTED: complement factor H [Myotis davidii]|uniref:complement factor H n=1 Tax=Myotis davidii TaxID=225400 RepID=UPI000767CC15|nr:PREDICTED: complement factor H [Myotis davidii]